MLNNFLIEGLFMKLRLIMLFCICFVSSNLPAAIFRASIRTITGCPKTACAHAVTHKPSPGSHLPAISQAALAYREAAKILTQTCLDATKDIAQNPNEQPTDMDAFHKVFVSLSSAGHAAKQTESAATEFIDTYDKWVNINPNRFATIIAVDAAIKNLPQT